MAINNERGERDMNSNRLEQRSSLPGDLPDSSEDRKKLNSEEGYIDLPDVKDIPGQEFVKAPPVGSLGDTTISSADEEGEAVFGRGKETERGTDFNVSREERAALEDTEYMPTTDENNLRRARMDSTDFQNEPLNERGFGEETSGEDLDLPTGEGKNVDNPGMEDEENDNFSLGSNDNDNSVEGTP
jgi:hypothetical protein